MHIRPFEQADWRQIWPIFHEIVTARETFAYDPDLTSDEARATWIETPPGLTVVAVDGTQVLGTAKMGRNRAGPGSHIATASFMVGAQARGRGVGAALLDFTQGWARQNGFAGIQFNAVAETNRAAVALYLRVGFSIVGTVPGAFEHPELGRVGLHIMYLPL